jgi:hypothetical protein
MRGVEMSETSAAGLEAGPSWVREVDDDIIMALDGACGVNADEISRKTKILLLNDKR